MFTEQFLNLNLLNLMKAPSINRDNQLMKK